MTTQHWVLLTIFLGALGAQLGFAEHWHDVLTPPMIGAVLVQIAAFLRTMFIDAPRTLPWALDDEDDH